MQVNNEVYQVEEERRESNELIDCLGGNGAVWQPTRLESWLAEGQEDFLHSTFPLASRV